MAQQQMTGGAVTPMPNRQRSAWQTATASVNGAGYARAFYEGLCLSIRGKLPWNRYRVKALNVAMRELGDLRAADAPEAEGRRFVATLDRFVDDLWAVPVRGESPMEVAETALDGTEDTHECALRHARAGGDRVALLNALDACIATDAHLAAIHTERCVMRQRERARVLAGEG